MISSLKNLLAENKTNCGAFDNSSLKYNTNNSQRFTNEFEYSNVPVSRKTPSPGAWEKRLATIRLNFDVACFDKIHFVQNNIPIVKTVLAKCSGLTRKFFFTIGVSVFNDSSLKMD